jgi:hypothetical protein
MKHSAARLLTMYRHRLTQITIRDGGCRPAVSQGRFFGRERDGHARSRLGISVLTTRSELDGGAVLNTSTVMPGARPASEHNWARCSATTTLRVVAERPHPDRRCLRVPWFGGGFASQVVWAGLRPTPHPRLRAATSRLRTLEPEGATTAASDDGCWRCGALARTSVKQDSDGRSHPREARSVNVSVLK